MRKKRVERRKKKEERVTSQVTLIPTTIIK